MSRLLLALSTKLDSAGAISIKLHNWIHAVTPPVKITSTSSLNTQSTLQ